MVSAILANDAKEAQRLLDRGCEVNSLDYEMGWTPLMHAAAVGAKRTLDVLLKNGADVNKPDADGMTPLQLACHNGHASIVKALISEGADTNAVDCLGFSALHLACRKGAKECIELLLDGGADTRATNDLHRSPITYLRKTDMWPWFQDKHPDIVLECWIDMSCEPGALNL
jgi:ankyrin repeat protein